MESLRTRLKRGAILSCLVVMGAATALQAQPPTGEIRLEIKDPSGASVVASGTLRNLAGGAARTFQTDPQGTYRLAGLPFGHYRLEISKTGFATLVVPIDVQSSTPVLRTVNLALASTESKVHVIATTPLAGTDLAADQIAGPI